MKSGRSGALQPDRLGLIYKASKCSDAGTGDPGVLIFHEASLLNTVVNSIDDAGSSKLLSP